MSTSEIKIVLKALDEASGTLQKAAGKIEDKLEDLDKANSRLQKSNRTVQASTQDVALAMNNVATSGFALYNIVDRVMDMQVSLDRANLQVKSSLNSVEDAQRRYADAVEKFGPNSEKALAAQKDLELAQERYNVALSRAEMIQGNLNEAIVQGAIQVLPTMITMITSVSTVMTNWTGITKGVNAALSFLAANPLVLVAAGIAALVAGLIWAYQNCEWFRNIINTIATYIGGAFMAAWNGLVTFWNDWLLPAINAIRGALEWLWNNVLAPLAAFLVERVLKGWQDMCNGFQWAYNTFLKPIFDALAWVYDNIIKPIAEFFAGRGARPTTFTGEAGGAGEQTPSGQGGYVAPEGYAEKGIAGSRARWQHGGIVTKPTIGLLGEAGPEMVIPLRGMGALSSPTVNITIQGSVDERLLRLMEQKLKTVLVEASSTSAPSTFKRIRVPR